MPENQLNKKILKKLDSSIIDRELTINILNKFNRGDYDHIEPVQVTGFPPVDNKIIIDKTKNISYTVNAGDLKKFIDLFQIEYEPIPDQSDSDVQLSEKDLREIGKQLMPFYSFGVLNGGSATSYADSKKNSSFNEELFKLLEEPFNFLAKLSTGKAKGITPAFLNPDGSAGPSFIELKMRALLLNNCSSLFQMTSFYNNDSISESYKAYENSPYLRDLIAEKKNNICLAKTGVQPLMAAYTHSSRGKKKSIFENTKGDLLPIPGGHGQCFITLKQIFKDLYAEGIRFISIGNVDNSGYTPDPVSLAILALSRKQAGFDFSYKTPVDVKGGILIKDERGRLNCADLGVAIDKKTVDEAVKNGDPILFNCATGLFNLEYLVENIDTIIESLPMRFNDQDKDAGLYSQAEQVTWEVVGLLDDILIFAIDKYDRFLAAKIIMENLMTSGISLNNPAYPHSEIQAEDLKGTALKLNRGLENKLKTVYGLELIEGRWRPIPVERL